MTQHAQQPSAKMKQPKAEPEPEQIDLVEEAAEVQESQVASQPSQPPEPQPAEWLSMDAAPKNGTPLVLRARDGREVEAYWRHTRAFNSSAWRPTGYWCPKFGAPAPIDFEPVAWRHYRSNEGIAGAEKK